MKKDRKKLMLKQVENEKVKLEQFSLKQIANKQHLMTKFMDQQQNGSLTSRSFVPGDISNLLTMYGTVQPPRDTDADKTQIDLNMDQKNPLKITSNLAESLLSGTKATLFNMTPRIVSPLEQRAV